jgi:hypothetical protein
MDNAPSIRLIPSGISPVQARDARARAWAYCFEIWHAKKGRSHDLT